MHTHNDNRYNFHEMTLTVKSTVDKVELNVETFKLAMRDGKLCKVTEDKDLNVYIYLPLRETIQKHYEAWVLRQVVR